MPVAIDPSLHGLPTQGPNDYVPHGFHPIPYSMVHSRECMPMSLVDGRALMAPSCPPPLTIQGATVSPHSDGILTMERLAQMVLSLEARLTSQEWHHVAAQPTQLSGFVAQPTPMEQEGNPVPVGGPFINVQDQECNEIVTPPNDPEPQCQGHETKECRGERKTKAIAP